MIDPATFFKGLGVAIVFVFLVAGGVYWIWIGTRKISAKTKFFIKYKILRRQYDPKMVEMIMTDIANNVDPVEMWSVLLRKGMGKKELKEVQYVYAEIKKIMKEGKK